MSAAAAGDALAERPAELEALRLLAELPEHHVHDVGRGGRLNVYVLVGGSSYSPDIDYNSNEQLVNKAIYF